MCTSGGEYRYPGFLPESPVDSTFSVGRRTSRSTPVYNVPSWSHPLEHFSWEVVVRTPGGGFKSPSVPRTTGLFDSGSVPRDGLSGRGLSYVRRLEFSLPSTFTHYFSGGRVVRYSRYLYNQTRTPLHRITAPLCLLQIYLDFDF